MRKAHATPRCIIPFGTYATVDAEDGGKVLLNENDVETCCLLERLRNAKDYIPLKLDMEDYYKIKDAEEDKKNDSKNVNNEPWGTRG